MAEKPRVKAPKQRGPASQSGGRNTRTWAIVAGIVGLVIALGVVAAALGFVGGGGGGKTDIPGLRTTMQKAGCTLQVAPALEGVHSITDPSKTSPKWNTDPPTSGPHYAVPAVFGIYEEPIELARLVHNLEHGGIYILYGNDVPDSTVEQLRSFYEHHKTGTIMAPLDRLGDKIALGAWVVDGDTHSGFLAKCPSYDENAFGTFFRTLQFRGPERFDPSQLQPGM
jgi:Protein of unknown function (DUF3105)